uniref:Cytochrome c oxidase polypeptide VIa n=1 Tax=Cyprinus carpio TaxID=7962 RepID=A0A8C2JRK3_CYPCA
MVNWIFAALKVTAAIFLINVYFISQTMFFLSFPHVHQRFPWGDGTKTLFHNPHVNALPDGYEHHE